MAPACSLHERSAAPQVRFFFPHTPAVPLVPGKRKLHGSHAPMCGPPPRKNAAVAA